MFRRTILLGAAIVFAVSIRGRARTRTGRPRGRSPRRPRAEGASRRIEAFPAEIAAPPSLGQGTCGGERPERQRRPLRGIVNNGRMRTMYLPAEFVGGGFLREPDPSMTLSRAFKTMSFWIVSRANNCATARAIRR